MSRRLKQLPTSALQVQFCDIWPMVWGSDHCPVLMWLRHPRYPTAGAVPTAPPALCAALLPQCRRRQVTLHEVLAGSGCLEGAARTARARVPVQVEIRGKSLCSWHYKSVPQHVMP